MVEEALHLASDGKGWLRALCTQKHHVLETNLNQSYLCVVYGPDGPRHESLMPVTHSSHQACFPLTYACS